MQAQSRRKGSATTEYEARQEPPLHSDITTRSGSAPRGKQTNAKRSGSQPNANNHVELSARSGSQPKQRVANTNNTNSTKPKVPTQTPYEVALAKMKKAAAGKTDEQQEQLLQQLLQQQQFEDAAYLIMASPFLADKYNASDVIRLLIDAKQFEKAAQLIRDMKLQSNQLLVTLFIRELVQCSLFQSAVRYAQEMVENFGKNDQILAGSDQPRAVWTPQALIQAMIRAQQFRSALKYAKQFDLLDVFPPAQLIASMFDVRSWEEAVSSVLEYRLFHDFPLEVLVQRLLKARQWNNAIKCINKLPTKDLTKQYYEALVREAARVGDFVTSIRYLREFKLDAPEMNSMLLKYLVDCMLGHREMYKAIKYSIKFGLHVPDEDAEETGEVSVYDTEVLIRKSIEYGQYHVAVMYVKKLKLKEKFSAELAAIQRQQEAMIREFHMFVQARESQYQHPQIQQQLVAIVGNDARNELVDQVVEEDMVLSIEEEVIPRKTRNDPSEEADSGDGSTEPASNVPSNGQAAQDSTDVEAPRKSSRFSFAREETVNNQSGGSALPQPPPGLAFQSPSLSTPQQQAPAQQPSASRAPPPGLGMDAPGPSSSFDFAQFAATLQSATGPAAPPPPSHSPFPMPPQQGLGHLFPHQSAPMQAPPPPRHGAFYPPPPPPQGGPQFNGNHGYLSGPMPPPLPPPHQQQSAPMLFHQQQQQQGFPHQPSSNNGAANSSFDITSLTMQFHARPSAPGFGNAYPGPGLFPHQSGPPLPPGVPGGLFPTMGPPPPSMQPPPPPPQPTFSMSYTTSVVTTRPKKP